MESISIKFQEEIVKKIDLNIAQHNFNSRTEFIREAVRDKLANLNKEELIQEFLKFKGKAGKKTTPEDNKKTRDMIGKELMGELDKRFN